MVPLGHAGPRRHIQEIPPAVLTAVRFLGLSSGPLLDRFMIPAERQDKAVARMLGLTGRQLADVRDDFRRQLSEASDRLLTDQAFSADVSELPFAPGDQIVVLGDSLSADALSWANLLGEVLARKANGARVVNRALGGQTTAEAIASFLQSAAHGANWFLILLGTNDARRHGSVTGARMASGEETTRNIRLLLAMARAEGKARAVIITPPPVGWGAEAGRDHGVYWLPEDLEDVRQAVLAADPAAVDLFSAFMPTDEFLSEDGVHPTFEGQQKMLRFIVDRLAGLPRA